MKLMSSTAEHRDSWHSSQVHLDEWHADHTYKQSVIKKNLMFFNHQHAVQNVTQNYSSGEQLSSGDVYECACNTCGHTCNSVYQYL